MYANRAMRLYDNLLGLSVPWLKIFDCRHSSKMFRICKEQMRKKAILVNNDEKNLLFLRLLYKKIKKSVLSRTHA